MLINSVQAAANWVAWTKGAKRALLAVFAGAISVLAFAPIHGWPVLFVSFGLFAPRNMTVTGLAHALRPTCYDGFLSCARSALSTWL